jgi:hypothetical protein
MSFSWISAITMFSSLFLPLAPITLTVPVSVPFPTLQVSLHVIMGDPGSSCEMTVVVRRQFMTARGTISNRIYANEPL